MDQLKDRACEWVNENCPDLEGEEYDSKVRLTMAELQALDDAADEWMFGERASSFPEELA
jgi:hypothetical protein